MQAFDIVLRAYAKIGQSCLARNVGGTFPLCVKSLSRKLPADSSLPASEFRPFEEVCGIGLGNHRLRIHSLLPVFFISIRTASRLPVANLDPPTTATHAAVPVHSEQERSPSEKPIRFHMRANRSALAAAARERSPPPVTSPIATAIRLIYILHVCRPETSP
jgi:hypothetical protein